MNNPFDPLKESIKKVPIMKYALAVVGLASAAATVFAYFKSMKYGIIAISVVLIFMVLIILVTNIPKIKHLQFFVTAFLSFILIVIFTVSGWFVWTLITDSNPLLDNDALSKEITIDVENTKGESIMEGTVKLKITGNKEIKSEIFKGIVEFPTSYFSDREDSVRITIEEKDYNRYMQKVGINDLLDNIFVIKLNKKSIEMVDAVFNLDREFCDDLITKLSGLKIKTTKQQTHIFNLKPMYSGNVENIKDNLYKYQGGYLIIKVNGTKVPFENKTIEPINVRFGTSKINIEKQIKSAFKNLTCSFSSNDINKIVAAL